MPTRKNLLLGRWRITEMELWDTDFVDMLEPAYITFEAKGGGEFAFGAVRGDLDCRYGPDGVRFTWEGSDEMDPAFALAPQNAPQTARSRARSAFTAVMSPPSKHANGDFFRSLLDKEPYCPSAVRSSSCCWLGSGLSG